MNKKGFTLIELLGVVLIISLLVIIVLPKITNSVNNFSPKTDKLIMNIIEDAAKLYVEDNSSKFIKNNDSNYCVTIQELVNADYLKGPVEYNGENITKTKGLKVKYNNGFEYEIIDLYKGSCTLGGYIKNLYSETKTTTVNGIEYSLDETHLLMNDRLGNQDVNKLDGNIRYYGANPNNYIDIGDRDKDGNIIFWRIIGVFKDIEVIDENDNVTGKQDLVKIIRADKLTVGEIDGFSWDYKYNGTSTGYSNDWKTASLNEMLNNAYYNSEETSYYNKSTTPVVLNFESTGLSSTAHNKIELVNWNPGGSSNTEPFVNEMYQYEREIINKSSGKVALMNVSDYGYSVDLSVCQVSLNLYSQSNCINNNWLSDLSKSQWTIVRNSTQKLSVRFINTKGKVDVDYGNNAFNLNSVRPVLYLKSSVGILEEKTTNKGVKYFVVE